MSVPLAGARTRAADLAAIFPVNTDAWKTYVPTLVQSVAVANTTTYAAYTKIGRTVLCAGRLDITGAGTAGNSVTVGLPVPAASGSFLLGAGSFRVQDASASLAYPGMASPLSTTTFGGVGTGTGYFGQATGQFTAGLAVGDFVSWLIVYESAS